MKLIFIRKSIWKKFDAYTYSILTDNLPVNKKIIEPYEVESLKTKEILSIKELLKTKKEKKNNGQ